MILTMYRCGILLFALTLAVASPPKSVQPTDGPETDQSQDSDVQMSDLCVLGTPTFMCYMKCVTLSLKPSCDMEKGQCYCVSLEAVGDQGGDSQTPQDANQISSSNPDSDSTGTDDDGRLHMIFYIFDMSSLFGDDNETSTTALPQDSTSTVPPVLKEDIKAMEETVTLKGWASAHLLAVVIVALLSILVIVELFACLKKQKTKHKEANMFNSLGVPNKS